MFRQLFCVTLLASLVFWSLQSTLAQVGAPPPGRPRPEQPFKIPPPERKPPPGPTAEDILRLLFPPEEFYPDDDPDDDEPPRPREPRKPRVLSSKEVAQLSPYQQRGLLRKAVQSLDEDFDRLKTGEGWKKHLKTETLGSGVWCGKSVSPDAKTRDVMGEIADRFDAIAKEPKYKAIPKLWGFQTIRASLREYAIEPVELSRREIRVNSKGFIRSLDQVKSGDGWKKFLKTDEVTRLANSKMKLAEDDEDVLRKIVEQFKRVEDNPDYRAVANMKGFKETSSSLKELANKVMQAKPSTSTAKTKKSLESLTASLRTAQQTGKEMMEAQQVLNQAKAGSPEADKAGKVLMALKQGQLDAKDQSREQIGKIQKLMGQAVKKERAEKTRRDPKGTVRLIAPDRDEADRKQALKKLTENMRAINKARQGKKAAREAMAAAAPNSLDAEAAQKMVSISEENYKEAKSLSEQQINKLKDSVAQSVERDREKRPSRDPRGRLELPPPPDPDERPDKPSRDPKGRLELAPQDPEKRPSRDPKGRLELASRGREEYKLLQFHEEDDGDTETVTLLQFHDEKDPCKKGKYTLIQFHESEDPNAGATVTIMQFQETSEFDPEEVTLMQFQEPTDSESEGYILLQFEDEADEEEAPEEDAKSEKNDKSGS